MSWVRKGRRRRMRRRRRGPRRRLTRHSGVPVRDLKTTILNVQCFLFSPCTPISMLGKLVFHSAVFCKNGCFQIPPGAPQNFTATLKLGARGGSDLVTFFFQDGSFQIPTRKHLRLLSRFCASLRRMRVLGPERLMEKIRVFKGKIEISTSVVFGMDNATSVVMEREKETNSRL